MVTIEQILKKSFKNKKQIFYIQIILILVDVHLSLGLGPQNAMQVAEKLYLGGYITYPRTESTKYADRFDFNVVL